MNAVPLNVPVCDLGESPVWHQDLNSVYWADLLTPVLHCYNCTTQQHSSWPMPARMGCIALRDVSSLWLAMGDGVYCWDLLTQKLEKVASVLAQGYRMNDGKCDALGRFWFGSVGPDPHQPDGKFYCMEANGAVRLVADGYHIPNGIGWSLDQKTLYHCDSLGRCIYRYRFDLERGEISERERWYAELSDSEPDGMAVDSQGRLWVAQWNGWRLDCFDQQANIVDSIDMPVQRPTSCAFNADYSTLYVSSCSKADSGEARLAEPSGRLFMIDLSS